MFEKIIKFIVTNFKKFVIELPNTSIVQLFRSVIVGAAATLVDMGILIALKELFKPVMASASEQIAFFFETFVWVSIAYACGIVANYLLTTFWAFRGLNTKKRGAEFAIFCVINLLGLGLNYLIIWFFESVLGKALAFGVLLPADKYYIVGKIVATIVVFAVTFVLKKFLLYRKSSSK